MRSRTGDARGIIRAIRYVVATWNGTAALLSVNCTLVDSTNDAAASGVYNPNTAAGTNFIVVSTDTGSLHLSNVPEPSPAALIALAGLANCGRRSREGML